MNKLRDISKSSLSLAAIFVLAATAFGQSEASKTKTAVINMASITTTDVAGASQPVADVNKAESTEKPKSPTSPQSSDSPVWQFEIRPYGWLAGMDGTLRVNNTTADVSVSSSEAFGAIDFVAAVQFEAIRGNWRLIVDQNYMNLGTTGTGPLGLVTLDVQPTLNLFEIGGSYMAAVVPNKNATVDDPRPPHFTAEILGGVRWFHLGLGLQANNNPPVEGSRNLIGPFIGNRFKASPHKALTLIGKYSVGNSGSGGGFAWSAEGLVDLRFKKSFSLAGGYRVLNLKANQVENTVGFDGALGGVVLYMTLYR